MEPHDWATQGDVTPLRDQVLVCDMESGDRLTRGGLILLDDNGKNHGIRPRTCTVYAVGEGVDYVSVGDQVLVSHGRWSRGVKIVSGDTTRVIRKVDTKDILAVLEP
jgi:co-chaperonin GroES (HSP10)